VTSLQKYAVFHLVVLACTLAAVGALLLATGRPMASLAGFALLALIGIRGTSMRGTRSPIQDERDEQIVRRAAAASYTIFWICFVAWGVVLTLAFQNGAAVPIVYIAPAVWVGMWLVLAVRAVAILALNRASTVDARERAR